MTLGTLLYFLHYQEFYLDGEQYTYTIPEFVAHSMYNRNKSASANIDDTQEQGFFAI